MTSSQTSQGFSETDGGERGIRKLMRRIRAPIVMPASRSIHSRESVNNVQHF
jgi:hypothetical protein